jgi:2-methylcitrate dehydratase PrpD
VTCESFARTRVTATRSPRETSAAKIKNTTQVERIDIDMPEAAYGHGGWQAVRPLEPIGAQMNVDYAVAVALLDGPAPRPLDVLPIRISPSRDIEVIDIEYKAGRREEIRIA